MPTPTRTQLAALNNAAWCDAVCASHGIPGDFQTSAWICNRPTPRFYPNIVTLTPDDDTPQQSLVRTLRASLTGPWAVKDSFDRLDLTALGFAELFKAEWIWRDPATPLPPGDGYDWSCVADIDELTAWEKAWNGNETPDERTFLPALLASPDVAMIAARHEHRIVGGVIANQTGDVVGLSNLFVAAEAATDGWAGAVAAVTRAFPGLAIVGYEGGDDLVRSEAVGFERIGQLRVWGC